MDAHSLVARGQEALLAGAADQALIAFERALLIEPSHGRAHAGRGRALAAAGRGADALGAYQRAVELDPLEPSVFLEIGHLMLRLGRIGNAYAAFSAALQLAPGDRSALEGRTKTLLALNRHEDALPGLAALQSEVPHQDYLPGLKFHAQLHCCDWSGFDAQRHLLADQVRRGRRADNPFSFMVHSGSPADQRRCATIYAEDRCAIAASAPHRGVSATDARLRVAYLSADFREHPVAQLMAGVFESHDRSRLETFAFSAGPPDLSPLRRRLERTFDHFLEIADMSDAAVAARMAESALDIVVDLGGHTTNSRTRVLAFRPAPVQVAFLGFPGTSGTTFLDYIIADRYVIPAADREHYTESVIYLPDTYLPSDFAAVVPAPLDRRAAGLPSAGAVFCCFNAPYKISPAVFSLWMRILKRVSDGVLWLREAPAVVKRNLREEAERRGMDPSRLIYAPHAPTLADHRARLALADVFLDTHPYNAHTTASDALGAGVPVITMSGDTFASRVAGSLLHAIGLANLAVRTPAEYEALAVKLADDRDELAMVKAHLRRELPKSPLFDTRGFCRHLETAYFEIRDRYRRGERPSTLWIARGDRGVSNS